MISVLLRRHATDGWFDSLNTIKDEGWQIKKEDNDWKHYCPECKDK